MEKILKGYAKYKLIAILIELCNNKKTYDRIKSILKEELETL